MNNSRGELAHLVAAGDCTLADRVHTRESGKLPFEETANFSNRFLDVQINTNGGQSKAMAQTELNTARKHVSLTNTFGKVVNAGSMTGRRSSDGNPLTDRNDALMTLQRDMAAAARAGNSQDISRL